MQAQLNNALGNLVQIFAAAFLALFAAVWLWVAWKVWRFSPSTANPTLEFSDAVSSTAGLLASSVGAGTAAVLGIQFQQQFAARKGATLLTKFNAAAAQSNLVLAGVLVYAIVGAANLIAWLGNSATSPSMVGAFGLGILGWMAGAFAAVFKAG